MYHALLHETDRQAVVDRLRAFVRECVDRSTTYDPLVDADRGGYTRTEYDGLRTPAGAVASAKWKLTRLALDTGGRLSAGIRLGWSSGFDSGQTLDYVYANRPRGSLGIGKVVDWFYLNGIGWRGIRVRRANLEALLRRAIADTHASGKPVRVLDIAAGAGRYVLETLAATPADVSPTALLRDYRQANLDDAAELASHLKLSDRVQLQLGDAFDRASLAATDPKPTIGIVSGLYELFPDNAPLRASLAGLADAIEPGGYLLYTCQPWHPQLEFIARVLPNREGRPWVMRRRTQGEMDALVRAAGFEKVEQAIDPWGIFTVSLARRV
jgi:SAM-dependent methyltransferase